MFTLNDFGMARQLRIDGYTVSDALMLRPNDIVELTLAMKRRGQHRVLVLERMTAREADVRLTEARENGWVPVRIIRQGPERPVTARLDFARGIA